MVGVELKPCPFCGQGVYLEKRPLWGDGHGYYGCYEYIVQCNNPECGCRVNLKHNNTIYDTDEIAKTNVINAWNRRIID